MASSFTKVIVRTVGRAVQVRRMLLLADPREHAKLGSKQVTDFTTYALLLRNSGDARDFPEGKRLHEKLIVCGYDEDTFLGNHLVQMYGNLGDVDEARLAFGKIRHPNVFSWNMMIAAFTQNGHLQEARNVFDRMPRKDVVSSTSMITAYSQNGEALQALELFRKMEMDGLQPDRAAFLSVLDACASIAALAEGKLVHAEVVNCGLHYDVAVGSALINMYGRCQELQQAKCLFDKMPQQNVVSWTAILAAYAQNGHLQEAISLFNKMPQQDVVSWNSMIAAHGQHGYGREALELFRLMDLQGFSPGKSTFVSILDACANLPALAEGKLLHANITAIGLKLDTAIQNALINMYGKCGDLEEARSLFDTMDGKDVVSWTSVIAAYAQHGHGKQALELFHKMALEGITPNEITLSSILSACNHTGLLDDGLYYFLVLHIDYGILAIVAHYVWIIDVLGRSGQLDKAEELINNMPYEPNSLAWKMLLGACQTHGDIERAARVAQHLFTVASQHSAPYVVLSNIYKADG